MKHLINKTRLLTLLVSGLLLLPQLAMAETTARAHFFEGRLLTASDLQDVQINLPGLYNPATGKRSLREDFENDILISKHMDAASSYLAQAFYNNEVIKDITVEIPLESSDSNRPMCYLKYKLENVMVTSYQTSSAGSDVPTETLSLNYEKIEWEYSKVADLENTVITSYETEGSMSGNVSGSAFSINYK